MGGFVAAGAVGGIVAGMASAGFDAAFGALVSAASGYFDEITNGAENIKADLDAHKGLIKDIKDLWDQADGAASNYGLTSATGLRYSAQENVGRLQSDLGSELGRVSGGGLDGGKGGLNFDFGNDFYYGGQMKASPLRPVMEAIRTDLADNKADIIAWRDEVAKVAAETPLGSLERDIANNFLESTQKAAELQAEMQRAIDVYKSTVGDLDASTTAFGENAKAVAATAAEYQKARPILETFQQALDAARGGVASFRASQSQDDAGSGASFGDLGTFKQDRGLLGWLGFAEGGLTGSSPLEGLQQHGQEVFL